MANRIKLAGTTSNSFQVGLNGATLSTTSVVTPYTLTLPANTGVNGQVLSTDGTGNLSWVTGGSGGGSNISNGTSNVNIATLNGNVTVSVNGTSNVARFSNTTIELNPGVSTTHGVKIGGSGRIQSTNGATAIILNDGANVGTAASLTVGSVIGNSAIRLVTDNLSGNGINIFPGDAGNYSLVLPSTSGSNRQLLSTDGNGVLSWADSGPAPGSNTQMLFNNNGNIDAANGLTFNNTTNAFSTPGNVTINGNLIVNGNTTTVNVNQLNVENPIIGLGRGPNNQPLTGNDGKDRGEQLWYYSTAEKSAFIGYDNSTGNLIAASDVSITSDVVTVNNYGTFVTGNVVAGNLSVSGNSNLTTINSNLITSTGNITGGNLVTGGALSVTGNANVGNLGTTTAIITTGNITTINSGLLQNGNSNIAIAANGDIRMSVGGTSNVATITGTGISVGNIISGNSNVVMVANGNIRMSVAGNANIVTVTGTGANVSGNLTVLNGNGNVTISTTANSNVLITSGTTNALSIVSRAFAIGTNAAGNLSNNSIILNTSGNSITPSTNSIVIGTSSGNIATSNNSIVISVASSNIITSQNSIILQANTNAGAAITALSNGFFVDPVRIVTNANSNNQTSGNLLFYNTSTKEVSTQSIPAFSATSSGNVVINTAFTPALIPFPTKRLDTDGWFNNSPGQNRFTPQRAGWYQISGGARIFVPGSPNASERYLVLRKNGAQLTISGGFGPVNATISLLVEFNGTTDYVDLAVISSATGNIQQSINQTYFTGTWVRP